MLCRKGSVSAGQGRRFCGKADRYGSRMARLTAMALRTMPERPRDFRDLGFFWQAARKRRPRSRKPCHNGQPCHREATTVSLAICGLPYGRHSGQPCHSALSYWLPVAVRPRQSSRHLGAAAVDRAVLALSVGCCNGLACRFSSSSGGPTPSYKRFGPGARRGQSGDQEGREGKEPWERVLQPYYNKVKMSRGLLAVCTHRACEWPAVRDSARCACCKPHAPRPCPASRPASCVPAPVAVRPAFPDRALLPRARVVAGDGRPPRHDQHPGGRGAGKKESGGIVETLPGACKRLTGWLR